MTTARHTTDPRAVPERPEIHVNGAVPLSDLRRGERARIATTDLSYDDAELLRAMGMNEECELRVFRNGAQCIVEVDATRLGLSRAMARRILVKRPA